MNRDVFRGNTRAVRIIRAIPLQKDEHGNWVKGDAFPMTFIAPASYSRGEAVSWALENYWFPEEYKEWTLTDALVEMTSSDPEKREKAYKRAKKLIKEGHIIEFHWKSREMPYYTSEPSSLYLLMRLPFNKAMELFRLMKRHGLKASLSKLPKDKKIDVLVQVYGTLEYGTASGKPINNWSKDQLKKFIKALESVGLKRESISLDSNPYDLLEGHEIGERLDIQPTYLEAMIELHGCSYINRLYKKEKLEKLTKGTVRAILKRCPKGRVPDIAKLASKMGMKV